MIGLETEEDSATVVLENRRFDVRVNGDEAGNDGAAARRCTIVRFEFTLTEFLKSHIHVCPHVLTSIQRDVCSLSILIVFFFSYPSCASLSTCTPFVQFISIYEFYIEKNV